MRRHLRSGYRAPSIFQRYAMKKLLLAAVLAGFTAACSDAPTAPARAAAPEAPSTSHSSAFAVTLELQGAPQYPGGNWYFGAALENHSSNDIFDYYFTWTSGLTVLKEGYGMHTYTVSDNDVGPDIDIEVEVTGPDGNAWDQILLGVGPWTTSGTRTITCYSC
jgi:hypothetical protein